MYWHDKTPSAVSSFDLSQDPPDCSASASASAGASASVSVRDGSYHSSSSSCTRSGYYDSNSSSSSSRSYSSSSSLSLIQLWIQYTDAVGAGLFRAPQGPLFFSKALSEGANRALHPKKAVDVVGNKQGK